MSIEPPPIKELFLAVLAVPAADRSAWLRQACGQDVELRERLQQMLAAHEKPQSLLDQFAPVTEAPEGTVTDVIDQRSEQPAMVIGPYKLIQPIGEGGMGTVFMAQQAEPIKRLVALKIIKPGMESRQVIARFEAERQALALMDHPNIAKVLDAGTTGQRDERGGMRDEKKRGDLSDSSLIPHPSSLSSGRPYFVMELVKGVPITKYCDDNRLTPRQRLELFIPICQAVQHAHQKGIIHRDLKPGNVLVAPYDGKPVPKVIDFGVAKAMGQQLTEHTLVTGFGTIVGTLEYMSPEQAELNQLDIDTRSDIYALGVMLYELLTGTTPLDRKRLAKAAFTEMLRMIREVEPPKPSTRLSESKDSLPSISVQRQMQPAKLTRMVRGELDWIVMKALEKDRSRRYETANGLSLDIQRYLANETVQACPPSAAYRIRKFARRNRVAIAVAATVAIALIVGALVAAWQARRAIRSEGLAEARLIAANQNFAEAEKQRNAARTQESIAKEQRRIAQGNERVARENESLARRSLYASQMNLAQQAWESANPARALQLLEAQRPRFGDEDLRGFEWYYLWRLSQGNQRFRLPTLNIDNARPLAYSPDGKTVASGYGWNVKIWDSSTGDELRQFGPHRTLVGYLAYAPDGKTLAACEGAGLVTIWDLVTGKARATIDSGMSDSLGFTADGKTLVAGGDAVRVWDLTRGREEARLRGGDGETFASVAVAPNGTAVAAGGSYNVNVWVRDESNWRILAPIEGHGWLPPVAISPDGRVLAAGKNSLRLYDMATGKQRAALNGHTGPVYSMAFSGDGKTIGSAGQDRTVRVWDTDTGQQRMALAHAGPVNAVAVSPDGKRLAAMASEGIRVWDVAVENDSMALRHSEGGPTTIDESLRHTGGVASVAFSPDGKSLVSLGAGHRRVWDPTSGRETSHFPAASHGRACLAISPDGAKLLTSGLPDGGFEVWSASGIRERILGDHTGLVTDLAISPDGGAAATVSNNGSVVVWDLATHRTRWSTKLGGWLTAVAFSPDGQNLAVGAQFGVVKLLDPSTGKDRATVQRFELAVTYTWSLAFSPDGKVLATGEREGIVRLWEPATGRLRAALRGHTDSVWCVGFSPDGKTLASASADRTVRLWDVSTGQERMTLRGHRDGVTSVVFAPDGMCLATGSHDGTVRLWRTAPNADARDRLREVDPDSSATPQALNELGDRLWESGRTDDAERAYREALARLELLLGRSTNDPTYRKEMVRSLLSLGLLMGERAQARQGEKARRQAQEVYSKLSPDVQESLVFAIRDRARKLKASSMLQAGRTYQQAVELVPNSANVKNQLAWLLATCPDPKARDSRRAVELAKQATDLAPKDGRLWNTLGVSSYQLGDWRAAIAALEKSLEILKDSDFGLNAFFLAKAQWQLGDKDQARTWYDRAVRWMDKNNAQDEELVRFRDEARDLLQVSH
jgi:WD40 repeat protein/serine/threonine protein kinase/Tfp pilus assembly protein PilF